MQLTIPKSKRQQLADNEVYASDYIPFSHFNSPTIFETKDNAQGCVISVRGIPFEVEDTETLNYLAKGINNVYQSLSDEFAVYVTTHRHLANQYPPGEFPSGFAQDFNEAYKKKFLGKQLFKNDIYITLIIKGGTGKIRKSISFIEKLSHKAVKGGLEAYRAKQAKKLETAVRNMLEALQPYAPKLLGDHENKTGAKVSELLEFFSILINIEKRKFLFPYEDIASYLPTKRHFFGHNAIQVVGNTKEDSRFLAALSIKKYCPETAPGMLDAILKAPFEYIATHSFLRINDNLAKELIKQQRSRLHAVDDDSRTQIASLDIAADDLASGVIAFGYHHNSIVCIGKTLEELELHVAKLTKLYQDQDITVVRETLNMESVFWAQLPGNFSRIRRGSLISSQNMAYFCSLHNYHHGYIDQNHLGSALIQVETLSQTPLYVNFHERASGNKNDLSKGHTTIIAPSNAGKTTLMAAFDAQAQKYNGKSIFFDRDRGLEIYVRANYGKYANIMPGHPTGFNPLQLPDKPTNRDFLKKWLGSLLIAENDPLTAIDEEYIANAINRNYTLPSEKRNLSNIASFFPSDFSKLPALNRWLRAVDKSHSEDGRLAYLFDNTNDILDMDTRMMGFDMTHLLDNESPNILVPVMLYLFHRIELAMEGSLVGIYLDEGWQYLASEYWRRKMHAWLPTLRKKNAYMVFATQSPGKVVQSPLRDELIQGSATNIYLPNPKAEEKDYIEGFKLSHREFEIIKNSSIQSRNFLIKQGHEAAIGRLNLSGMEDYIAVLSGNKDTVALLDDIRAEIGDDPAVWLPLFHERRKSI